MKSGLEDRNNPADSLQGAHVSMKSGLEDRNNCTPQPGRPTGSMCLNEVRPGRPEQYMVGAMYWHSEKNVSMKSGLEDRNNPAGRSWPACEQHVSMKSGLEDRNNVVFANA